MPRRVNNKKRPDPVSERENSSGNWILQGAFRLFGPVHLAILGSIPAAAGALAGMVRHHPGRSRRVAAVLGAGLGVNELVWYGWRLHAEGFRFPGGLPLELCDLTLWLTVVAMLTLRPAVFEFAWLAGVGGSVMAVITPDLWAAPLSYPTIYFFVAHGGEIASPLFLVWSGMARPRPGCVWRALILLNGYAALVGSFNAVFHTNYMYLCTKPASASLLDFFGPWPVYLIGGEAAAAIMFWLLWMPFRWSAGSVAEG